jgi:hypothetical protein
MKMQIANPLFLLGCRYLLIAVIVDLLAMVGYTIAGLHCRSFSSRGAHSFETTNLYRSFGYWKYFDSAADKCLRTYEYSSFIAALSRVAQGRAAFLNHARFSFLALTTDMLDFPLKFGRVVAFMGVVFGWMLWLVVVAMVFARVPKQHILLKMVGICSTVMAVASVLLFVGMVGEICIEDKCKPRLVLSAIPSCAFFIATAILALSYHSTDQMPST